MDAAISEDHSEIFGNYRDGYRLSWTIAFHDSKGGAGAHIQVSLMESQKVAFDHWTEAMRERFGERPVIEPVELAEVLDAHKVEAA